MSAADLILARLAYGPATTAELAAAAGCDHAAVYVALSRLMRRGEDVKVIGSPGSHRGCLYAVLLWRHEARCTRCGYPLARDHRRSQVCSPCERAMVTHELAQIGVTA